MYLLTQHNRLHKSLLVLKIELAKKLLLALVIVCSIGLPISLSRWQQLGFQPIFIVHILVTLAAYFFHFKPDKSNYRLYLTVIIVLLTGMAISGVLSFGLQSGAMAFSIFCAFIIAIGWGVVPAVIYAIGWCLFVLVMGYLFTHNYIDYSVSPLQYSQTMGAWIIVAVGSSIIIILMLTIAKQTYTYFASLIEKIERQKKEIEELANRDNLTCCLNGRRLNTSIRQALLLANEGDFKVALLYIDLDKFKSINDKYGHHTGDDVLREFCSRVQSVLRDADLQFRVGGDEFVVLLPRVTSRCEVEQIVQRIVDVNKRPYISNNNSLTISASIGVAITPKDGNTEERLKHNADTAMYCAKKNNTTTCFYCDKH